MAHVGHFHQLLLWKELILLRQVLLKNYLNKILMTVLEAIVIEDVGEVLKLGLSIMQKIMVWNLDSFISCR